MGWTKGKTGPGPNGCVDWTAATRNGYGVVRFDGRMYGAHIVSLMWKLGRPLDDGKFACHTCDRKCCVNPEHLFEGTRQDNMEDMKRKGRQAKGSDHPNSRFVPWQIETMRTYRSAGATQQFIADLFATGQTVVGRIVDRKSWSHV